MAERKHRYGNLVFDRDAIVRASLRAYIEAIFGKGLLKRLSFPSSDGAIWEGDLKRGALYKGGGGGSAGSYDVVAWTEGGVVGLAYELGFGPIEQLGLSVEAVTGGPDDVRGALPGLPEDLEPALVMAVGMLEVGPEHGQKDAGVGFWLQGDRVAGTFFDDPAAAGADRLAMWGQLRGGRLLPLIYRSSHPDTRATLAELDRKEAPIHALMDAVTDRALKGPTELTPAEVETLHVPLATPALKHVLYAQRMLQKVGITWPGSPDLPPETPRPPAPNPFLPRP